MQSDNTEEIKAKTEELKQSSYKIAEELYKQQGAQGAQPQDGTANASTESTTDEQSKASSFNKGSADDVDYEIKDDN